MTVTSERQTGIAGELRHVDKWYGDQHVLADVSVRVGARRDRRAHRPQRIRQVDGVAGARGPVDRPHRRPCRLGRARAGLPGAPAVPVAQCCDECRLRVDPQPAAARRGGPQGRPGHLATSASRPCRRVAAHAVRRSGATGLAGPRAGRRTRADAARRAVRRPGRADPAGDARPAARPLARPTDSESCWSPTMSTRPSRWPTGCWFSRTAGWCTRWRSPTPVVHRAIDGEHRALPRRAAQPARRPLLNAKPY